MCTPHGVQRVITLWADMAEHITDLIVETLSVRNWGGICPDVAEGLRTGPQRPETVLAGIGGSQSIQDTIAFQLIALTALAGAHHVPWEAIAYDLERFASLNERIESFLDTDMPDDMGHDATMTIFRENYLQGMGERDLLDNIGKADIGDWNPDAIN